MVRNYIVDTMKKLSWHIEEDSFNDTTPYGVKRFTNIIATKDPKAPRRVILAAHFDSKFFASASQSQASTVDSGYRVRADVSGSSSLGPRTQQRRVRSCWTLQKR